ncbi:MAG TPA: dephospho-CoA kinase [Acholeplasmataceae bacterium]|nr:dephospho-CoA kinase [Acholeplasmataceae bacterium]
MIIGITGSIATGKSTVTKYLSEKGYKIIDSDKIVHKLLSTSSVLSEISLAFGRDLIVDGVLVRKLLARMIFDDEEKRKLLNSIIHPRVISEIKEETNNYKGVKDNLIFVDIPLLYEEKLEYLVDKIIVVYVPKNIQLERLMARDGIDLDYANKKINASMDIELKKEKADYIIDNSKDVDSTYKQVDEVLRRILNEI